MKTRTILELMLNMIFSSMSVSYRTNARFLKYKYNQSTFGFILFCIFCLVILNGLTFLILLTWLIEWSPHYFIQIYNLLGFNIAGGKISDVADLGTVMSYYDSILAYLSLFMGMLGAVILMQITTVRKSQIDDRIADGIEKISEDSLTCINGSPELKEKLTSIISNHKVTPEVESLRDDILNIIYERDKTLLKRIYDIEEYINSSNDIMVSEEHSGAALEVKDNEVIQK